jgi:hypothetical protein
MIRNAAGHRLAACLLPALLVGVMSLAACRRSGTSAQATPTPTLSAQQILQHAKAVAISDMAFTFTSTDFTGNGGSAEFTKSPARVEMTFTIPDNGVPISASMILDTPTSTFYFKFGSPGFGVPANVWYKDSTTGTFGSTFSGMVGTFSTCATFNNLSDATLAGSDTVHGVAVWHIKGTETAAGPCGSSSSSTGTGTSISPTSSGSASVDVYVRQSNYYPVKATIAGDGANTTFTYTSVNTGLTITLPANAKPFPGP